MGHFGVNVGKYSTHGASGLGDVLTMFFVAVFVVVSIGTDSSRLSFWVNSSATSLIDLILSDWDG